MIQSRSKDEGRAKQRTVPTSSALFADGTLVELLYNAEQRQTRFAVEQNGTWRLEETVSDGHNTLVPYSPSNNLLRHKIILFPSMPVPYESEMDLAAEIEAFIHRYVDVSARFERIAAHYVLLSWVYDRFNELPYLRLRGDYGTGKTRFLLTLGSILYKPIFASGASTVSPLFHMLDRFRGTLILDEADFRFSDEKSEIVKILNNGNARGFPILRTMVDQKREFNPRAFHVFGPKLIATRGDYDDQALESRCITETMGVGRFRRDIPINLPEDHAAEALALRNKLLVYRFRNFGNFALCRTAERLVSEGRIAQIVAPLLSVATRPAVRDDLCAYAKERGRELLDERGMAVEAQVLEIIKGLLEKDEAPTVSLRSIASDFRDRYGREYDEKITSRWIGSIIRKRLHLRPTKSHGIYLLPLSERPKLTSLFERYGLHEVRTQPTKSEAAEADLTWEPIDEVDSGDIGDGESTSIPF